MFSRLHPLSWTFHHNTSRWTYNPVIADKINREPPQCKEYGDCPAIKLEPPRLPNVPIAQCLDARSSCRDFFDAPLERRVLSTVLAYTYGMLGIREVDAGLEYRRRPTPSAGGLYPLESYVLARNVENLASGVYHYASATHCLEQLAVRTLSGKFLGDLFLNQYFIENAAVVIVLTAIPERTMEKYGDRGYRYILMEAGHAAHNANLCSQAFGLGSLNMGGFYDDQVADVLGLDIEEEIPLYAVAVGHMPLRGD